MRKRSRRVRMGLAVLSAQIPTLPSIDRPKLKDILQLEANRPLRGGNSDLAPDSLFGDGRQQLELGL